MRALVAFLLGYYLGAKDGPERLSKMAQSARDIMNSSEFQTLRVERHCADGAGARTAPTEHRSARVRRSEHG